MIRAITLGHDHTRSLWGRHAKMADLRMKQAVQRLLAHNHTPAHPRTYRDVNQRITILTRPPQHFPNGGGIDIRIKPDGHLEPAVQRCNHGRMLPARLRRGGDETISGAGGIKVNGAKGSHPDSLNWPVLAAGGCDELDGLPHRMAGIGGFNAGDRLDVLRTASHGHDKFGASSFDGGNERGRGVHAAAF